MPTEPIRPIPNPTESELAILQILWRKGPCSVRTVWSELGQKSGYTTVLKFLQIMLEKGLVQRDDTKQTHIYQAAAAAAETQEKLLHHFIERAFGGSASELVLRALSAQPVSAAERNAIRALLSAEEGKRP
jgi:BlaI family transcriptional regulator, penicillinase repressor